MKNSKTLVVVLIIVGIVLIFGLTCMKLYNRMVTSEEEVSKAWAQVENVYQRRADLIPNLVKTVQGAADFESSTLENVIQARANATSTNIKVDPNNLTEESLAKFQQAQDGLGSALNKLMVVVERYPELKATQNFQQLQAQLEGTENRITVERQKFNEEAMKFNAYIRRFPNSMVAGMFGFEKKAYFAAQEGAEKAPEVGFDFKK